MLEQNHNNIWSKNYDIWYKVKDFIGKDSDVEVVLDVKYSKDK